MVGNAGHQTYAGHQIQTLGGTLVCTDELLLVTLTVLEKAEWGNGIFRRGIAWPVRHENKGLVGARLKYFTL